MLNEGSARLVNFVCDLVCRGKTGAIKTNTSSALWFLKYRQYILCILFRQNELDTPKTVQIEARMTILVAVFPAERRRTPACLPRGSVTSIQGLVQIDT